VRLTPFIIEAAYEFLRATPPYRGWKLPHADDVEFVITRNMKKMAHHCGYHRDRFRHEIGVSELCVSFSDTLLRCVGHEMIHQYQQRKGTETPNTEHNAEFMRLARSACRQHGWDPRSF